jgi:hypothetical protein
MHRYVWALIFWLLLPMDGTIEIDIVEGAGSGAFAITLPGRAA